MDIGHLNFDLGGLKMINRTTGFINNNKVLFLFLLIYSVFNLLLINKFFPITEGWFQDYARYMMAGQVPYRDFYVPVPPGFLYLNELLRYFFGDVFLYYRIYGFLERLVLVTIVFFLFKRLYNEKLLFISLLTGSVIYIANIQDIFYGYYQTSFLFSMLVLVAVVKMYENYDSKPVYYWSILFGAFSVISFLFKQTIGVLLPIFLESAFVVLTIKRDWRKTIACGLASFFSAIIILGVVGYIFTNDNALLPCIEQIFLGAKSKGSLSGVFFNFIPRMITKHSIQTFLASGAMFLCYYIYSHVNRKIYKNACISLLVLIEYGIIYNSFFRFIDFHSLNILKSIMCVLIIIVFLIISYFTLRCQSTVNSVLFISAVLFACFFTIQHSRLSAFNYMDARNARQSLIYLMFFINLVWLLYEFYRLIRCEIHYNQAIKFLILCASFGIMYAHGLSAIVEDHGTLLIVTLLLCELLSVNIAFENFIKSGIVYFCVLTILCVFIQKCNLPYHWWGVNALHPIREAKYEYKDPNLAGIIGDKASVNELNRIYELVSSLKKDGDTMYTFPHINYFNVMCGLDSPTFAKVHYFDVCPDYMIDKDLEQLKAKPPTFVLIQNFDENAWKIHEDVFRDGKLSAQRKIIEHYHLQILQKKYKMVDSFKIGNSEIIIFLMRI